MSGAVRVATRRSALARWQAHHVSSLLRAREPGLEVALHEVVTRGDKLLDVALARVGGKGLFVKEIEEALLSGEADLAVHSMKDLPAVLAPGLGLAAVPARADPRDALCAPRYRTLAALPEGARVGTSSLRRSAQLLAVRPDLRLELVRGNVETRLRKAEEEGGLDAVVLAHAGLLRLGLAAHATHVFSPEEMLPAVGQGALALEVRDEDGAMLARVAPLDDPSSRACVQAERALLRRLEGGCQVPIAAHATLDRAGPRPEAGGRPAAEEAATLGGAELTLRALVASPDGRAVVRGERRGPPGEAVALGEALGDELLARGAGELLAALGEAGS